MYMVCDIKEARDPLLKLMEQAQSGFGLLQDEKKIIRIMLHENADSRVGIFVSGENFMNCTLTLYQHNYNRDQFAHSGQLNVFLCVHVTIIKHYYILL